MSEALPKPRVIDRVIGPSPREKALEAQIGQIETAFRIFADKHENFMIDMGEGGIGGVHEGLAQVDLMLDAQGWTNIWEYEDNGGLTLRQIKAASMQLRELVVGNPYIGNAYRIRNAQTNGGGCEFTARLLTGKREAKPLPQIIQSRVDEPWSQRYIFGNKAKGELERAAFTDGWVGILGREGDKRVQRIQIQEITGLLRSPNNQEEVLAYRRTWNPDPDGNSSEQTRTRWYYTDMVPMDERKRRVKARGGVEEIAEPEYTLIDISFNRQVGWTLGVPDALCVVAWARLYKEFLVNGYVMSRSLARLAYKVTVATAQGGQNAATTVATPGQSGSTYIEGSGNSLTPLASAGRGYDFSSGDSLAAAIAAGLGISLLALTGHAAGGSNAAVSTLDPISKATAAVRRAEWDDEYARIFRFFGLDRKLVVTWRDLPEDTLARLMQAWTLADQLEVFDGPVMQREVAKVLQVSDPGAIPGTWKVKSERGPVQDSTFGQTGTSPADGRGTDDGSGDSPDDHDDDNAGGSDTK